MAFLRKNNGYGIAILVFCLLIWSAESLRMPVPRRANSYSFNMDQSVNPCDNFYQYACGNFIKKTELKKHENIINLQSIMKNAIEKKLNQSINAVRKDEDTAHRLLLKLYKSCMNTDMIKQKGIEEVASIIKSLGGWPVVEGESWNKTNFDWIDASYKSRQIGYNNHIFFNTAINNAYGADSKPFLMVSNSRVFIDSTDLKYLNDEKTKEFKAYLNNTIAIAKAFGANRDEAAIEKEILETLHFERDILNNISELAQNSSIVPWREYLNAQMPPGVTVKEDDDVFVMLDFITKLQPLVARTSNRTIANYFMLNHVKSSMPYLSNELPSLKMISGNRKDEKPLERQAKCFEDTKLLTMALRSVYVQDHASQEMVNDAQDIARRVMEQYSAVLDRSENMDRESKDKAQAKMEKLSVHVGNLEMLLDNKKLEEYYKDLELSENSYFKNMLRIHKFNTDRDFEVLRKSVAEYVYKDLWDDTSLTSGIYYLPTPSVYLPVGILQSPVFNRDLPKYVNFGTFGYTTGHEIAMGFNAEGVETDEFGKHSVWVTNSTRKHFSQRIECLAKQHSNFTNQKYNKEILDSLLILHNVNDISGTKAAYYAYEEWVKENGEEEKLPGIRESPKQLFWLSMANMWCSKKRAEFADRFSYNIPQESIVLNTLRNSPEFAKDYDCSPESKMNPVTQCPMW